MYFRKSFFDEIGNPTEVELVCEKCENIISITENVDKIFSTVKSDYCITKDEMQIKCSCGNVPNTNLIERKNITPAKIVNSQSSLKYVPKCPTCGSPNVEKISFTKKTIGGLAFGLFSSNIRNTMRCKNCGVKW